MNTEPTKPNCYDCAYRRQLAGDAHSACGHPDACGNQDPFTLFMQTAGGLLGDGGARKKLGVTGDPHGIVNGWFLWPSNFDPVWLRSCNGFKQKAV
jgi:hypothetical protein